MLAEAVVSADIVAQNFLRDHPNLGPVSRSEPHPYLLYLDALFRRAVKMPACHSEVIRSRGQTISLYCPVSACGNSDLF